MSDLAVLRDAEQMLASVATVEDAAHLIDVAEAARVMAERMRLGARSENHATRIKLHAERRLAALVDAGQANGTIATHGGDRTQGSESEPCKPVTYRELGLSKRQVAEARILTELTDDEIDSIIDRANSNTDEAGSPAPRPVRRERLIREGRERRARRQRAETPPPPPLTSSLADIRHCSIEQLDIEPGTVRLVLTDPPYPAEFLPLWSTLAERAAGWLMPGGLLAAYTGCFHLPEVLHRLGEHLEYWWTHAVIHDGAFTQIRSRRVNSGWKPVVMFHHPGRTPIGWPSDVLAHGHREKSDHEWQQAESEAATIIGHLTDPGDLVVDPFLGSGTVAAAAVKLGRRIAGCDIDPAHVATAQARIAGHAT